MSSPRRDRQHRVSGGPVGQGSLSAARNVGVDGSGYDLVRFPDRFAATGRRQPGGTRLRTDDSRWLRLLAGGLVVLMVLVAAGCSSAPRAEPAPPWRQMWADDFAGPAGGGINTSYWQFDTGHGGFGTGELETMTSSRENVHLDGHGNLDIVALGHGAA